jgi:1-acyl-sn-glycerol-3-phosphate acyltransferase
MKKELRNFNRRFAKEYNWFRTLFYMSFLYIVVYGIYNLYYDYKIIGRENLPSKKARKGKYIYAANHVSQFDPPMVVMAAHCPIAFMAKKELFEPDCKINWLVKRLGAFAVDRTKPEIATFKTVKDILGTSWSLGIFPQGGTRPYGKLEGIKKGFAEIAKVAKADIVPVAIAEWSGYLKPFSFKREHVVIKVGKPISYQLPAEEIIYQWAQQISEMADYENCVPKPEISGQEKETANVEN